MNLFGRGRAAGRDAQGQTVEMGPPNLPVHVEVEQQQQQQQPSSWGLGRLNFFGGQNRNEARQPEERPARHGTGNNPDDSPKTPRFHFSNRPAPRLQMPWARGTDGREQHQQGQQQTAAQFDRVPERLTDLDARPLPAIPQPAVSGHTDVRGGGPRRFSGPDPAEMRLAQLADDGRRRSGGRRRVRLQREGSTQPGSHPKRFLFCFPWVDSRRTRMLILQSFVSGIFSAALLSTYLALSLTGAIGTSEFSILLILIILISAAFFCHSVIRLFIYFYRPPPPENERPGVQRIGGYAVPDEPIRVILARDEEDVEETDETAQESNKPKPPPYGAWRQSIRVDPNRIYWQRNNTEVPTEGPARAPEMTGPRPPSYISEDGVDYVVEARPRSMAPTAYGPQMVEAPVPPLPVHPSEAGRWNGQQDTTWRS